MPRYYSAADGVSVADLLHFGFDHLSAAEVLLKGNARHFDSAGYIAHLGFELLLKAWHLQGAGRFPGIHCLERLWADLQATSAVREFSRRDLATLRALDTYGELRYPNLNNPVEIGSDDLPRISELAKNLLKRMPKGLHEVIRTLHWSQKGGRVIMEKPVLRRR